jgi:LysM domain
MSYTFPSHTVRKGESLWSIARLAYGAGSEWPLIAQANALEPPYLLLIGMELRIPPKPMACFSPSAPTSPNPTPRQSPTQSPQPPRPSMLLPLTVEAMEIAWPTCELVINHTTPEVPFEGGTLVLKLDGKLSGKKSGGFTCETGWSKARKPVESLFGKVKASYKTDLYDALTEFKFDAAKGELIFKCGWKCKGAQVKVTALNKYEFSFAKQSVKLWDLSGELRVIVETTVKSDPKKLAPAAIQVGQFDVIVEPVKEKGDIMDGKRVTVWAAVAILAIIAAMSGAPLPIPPL